MAGLFDRSHGAIMKGAEWRLFFWGFLGGGVDSVEIAKDIRACGLLELICIEAWICVRSSTYTVSGHSRERKGALVRLRLFLLD